MGFQISQAFCTCAFLYVLAVNINSLPSHSLRFAAPEKWDALAIGLNLNQKWGMFETAPSKNGWYVARAKLNDGSEVDLLRDGAALDWSRPEYAAGMYRTFRWRKIFREMSYADNLGFQVFRAPIGNYMCRNWNAQNPPAKQIAEFDFIFCNENPLVSVDPLKPKVSRETLLHIDLKGT
jgi:hypothetical protein